MRKLLAMLLAFVMLFALCACGQTQQAAPAEEKPEAAAEGETQGESKRERPQRPEGFEGFEGFTEGKPERPDGETGETPAAAEGEQ